jgi:hypothetical protein
VPGRWEADGFADLRRMSGDGPVYMVPIPEPPHPITPEKETHVSQALRNKIYGVASALIPVAVILGFVTADQADQALNFTDTGLTLAIAVFTWASNVLAFVKSLPSKVTTIPVPAAQVASVNTVDGGTVTVR